LHKKLIKQDLHIHTIFSAIDGAVVPQQTIEMVAFSKHAEITGISDHFEMFMPTRWVEYKTEVKKFGFLLGIEVNGHEKVNEALKFEFDYFVYHCWGHEPKDYEALTMLQNSGKPVVVAHPYATATDLQKIPEGSIVEINNRYVWRYDWKKYLSPYINKFRWVLSSDAHQPNWLNQQIAIRVAEELKITETILF
jgi:histidinol phosphatase-like PHP family hydrolase